MLDVKRELAALVIDRLLGMRKVRREMERKELEIERERMYSWYDECPLLSVVA